MKIDDTLLNAYLAARRQGEHEAARRMLAKMTVRGSAIAQHIANAQRLCDDLKTRVAQARRGRPGATMAGDVLALHRALDGRTCGPARTAVPTCSFCHEAEDDFGFCLCGG